MTVTNAKHPKTLVNCTDSVHPRPPTDEATKLPDETDTTDKCITYEYQLILVTNFYQHRINFGIVKRIQQNSFSMSSETCDFQIPSFMKVLYAHDEVTECH